MSESKNNDLLPLLVILESIGKIQLYVAGFTDANSFFMAHEIITQNILKLKTEFEKIIVQELADGHFAIDECGVAKQSIFYRHIDFNAFLG